MKLTLFLVLAAVALSLPSAAPAVAQSGRSPFDGDPATTERIQAGDPVSAAIAVSQERFDAAPFAVLATADNFADSLAGAALTNQAPLLLTQGTRLNPDTATELNRILSKGNSVYVLGGPEAISDAVVETLWDAGFQPQRLAGETRVETALAVADEVMRRHPQGTVLLARSEGAPGNPTSAFADSMTGGSLAAAANLPILVTPTAELHPLVAGWISSHMMSDTVLLGGEAALSPAVQAAVPRPRRLAGPERTATAAAIAASNLWPRGDARQYLILDGGRADGWAYGLSAAGIAADTGSPPLLVVNGVTPETRRLVSSCGPADVDLLLVGDSSIISDSTAQQLTTYDGASCAGEFTALKQFNGCTDTLDYFVQEGLSRVGPYGLDGYYYGAVDDVFIQDGVQEDSQGGAAAPPAAGTTTGGDTADDSGGSSDEAVSDTNVQEVGVDEPDIIKVTSQAAYAVSGGAVQVMDLQAEAPVNVATLDLPSDAYQHELLLQDGYLLVLSSAEGYVYPTVDAPAGTAFAPEASYPEPVTHLTRFDLTDPTAPALRDSATIDGSYRSARMVDGVVHLVASANPTDLEFTYPREDTEESRQQALAHNRQVITDSTIANWLPTVTTGQGDGPAVDCDNVFAPPAFSGITTAVVASFDITQPLIPVSAAAVVANAETLYASTQRLVLSSSRWGVWNEDAAPQAVTTEVHSFDISDPSATRYVASGQVDGYVLNSFAISERDGYYRIATTTDPPFDQCCAEPATDNGITILTEGGGELFEVGRVFGLGLGERIFAVRYLGDLAAVVTFRQVDPLYLVDLTNPAAPRVTGELKIPGVSRYLHPLDDDHLLGVGQDGNDDGQLTGLQVSLFDISDRANPVRVDSVEYGPGTSTVEFDHKAFLYWAPLGRAIVPSDLYEADQYGAQAIDIDVAEGTLDAVGSLVRPDRQGQYVQRSFVVGDTAYTVGYDGIGAYDLVTLEPLGFGAFPAQGECCRPVD